MRSGDRIDHALASLFAEAGEPPGAHPSEEECFAYLAGELDEIAAERVLAHVELCRECSARLAELEPIATPDPPSPPRVADLERAAAWRAFEVLRRAATPAPPRAVPRWLAAVAAVLAVLAVGLGSWALTLARTNARLATALAAVQVDVPVVYLDAVRAGEDEAAPLPPGEGLVLLILTPEDPEPFPSYRVEILDGAGGVVWSGAGLALSDHGSLRIGVPRRRLGAGEARVRLFGVGAGGEELLAEHRVRLAEHGGG